MSKALLYELGQSISFGRLSLKAKVLWPMLLAASDEQGRGIAEPDAIKWRVCPNVQEIAIDDVPDLLAEMVRQDMIHLYSDGRKRPLYQIVRWWEFQQLAWAQPSRLDPPDGWVDRIRCQKKGGGQTLENWDKKGGFGGDAPTDGTANADVPSEQASGDADQDSEQGSRYVAPTSEQGSRQSNITQYNVTQSKEKNGETPAATPPRPPVSDGDQPPGNLDGWLQLVNRPPDGSNRQSILRWMHQTLFPEREAPDYGTIGKFAKQVTGAGRLAELMWRASAERPTGDILPYCLAIHKRGPRPPEKQPPKLKEVTLCPA